MKDEGTGINIKTDLGIKADLKADFKPVLSATPAGLKYVFNLLFGKKHAQVERMLKLADAQNSMDVKKILAGDASYNLSSGQLIASKNEESSQKLLIADKIRDDEVSNLIECSAHAAPYIQENHSQDGASSDFINRWRNEAKLISTETAQAIWGRVLAEEVNSPGSISLRTLDVIRNLSKYEAENFREACKFVLFDRLIADNKLDTPISAEIFSSIRDAGLLSGYTPGLYRGSKWPETKLAKSSDNNLDVFYIRSGKFFIFIEKNQANTSVLKAPSFAYWELTTAGRELYKVIRDSLEVKVGDVVKTLSEAGEDIISNLKYTSYTNIEQNQVDMNSIQNI